ncbi:hypothetical protein DRQ53_14515 [bacterium]|nr:MAG: hypothetical protein DRQ53_14515 [bacterium]
MTQADDRRVHRRLTLNSASNMARFAVLMAVTFFMTPYIVRTLGDAVYGFWVLLMSFLGYASILEMGVQPAVVKMVGQHRAVGANERLKELVTAALVFFLSVGTVVVVLSVTLLPQLVTKFVEGLEEFDTGSALYLMIALDATIMYLNYLFGGILYGCQRYHLRNVIDLVAWALNVTLILLLLEDHGILGLMIAKTSMDLLVLVLSLAAIPRVFPEFGISLSALNWSSFRDLMSFGGRVFMSATTTRLAFHAEPMIIGATVGAAATAIYGIPVKLIDYTRQISWTLTASFMPMFSELESRKDSDLLRKIYFDYSRYIFMILLLLPVLLFVYGPNFIHIWIGPEYAIEGRMVLYLLTASVLVESAQPLTWRFFIGVAHLNILVVVSAIASLLTVVGAIILVHPMGIAGVALSQFIGATLAQVAYLVHAARYLEVSPLSLIRQVNLRPALVAVVVYAVARTLAGTVGATTYPEMIIGTLISAVVHVTLCLRFAITPDERAFLARKIASLLTGK